MRLIAACPECQVQYWSDESESDQSIHCYCGALISLSASAGQDARVVRCSACGAAREKSAPACTFCSADFTIHEKDLKAICPQCRARISDRAKYCHHCGIAIRPQYSSGRPSSLHCPACADAQPLYSRKEPSAAAFLECHLCAGVWLTLDDFSEICRQAKSQVLPQILAKPTAKTRVADLSSEAGPSNRSFYRRCPVDGGTMNRRNVAAKSGVIVDYCADHGIWFDGNELAQLIDWIRQGGLDRLQPKRQNLTGSRRDLWSEIFGLAFGQIS